jgi:NADPH:quinone reductase-like Zn-dependent oxidoreductase
MPAPATSKKNKMKAIVQDAYGTADVLEVRDIDLPEIKDDEVLVRVHAAGVDRGVWHLMTGMPYFVRLILPDLGLRAPPRTPFEVVTWPAWLMRSAKK